MSEKEYGFQRPGLKMGVENGMFLSEIGILSVEGEVGTILERGNQMFQIAKGKFGSSASHVSLLRKRKKSNEKYKNRKKSKAGTEAEAMAEGGTEADEVAEAEAGAEAEAEAGAET
ncbi:hypothetical protein ACROYT_G012982 [Oculina patagonica]